MLYLVDVHETDRRGELADSHRVGTSLCKSSEYEFWQFSRKQNFESLSSSTIQIDTWFASNTLSIQAPKCANVQ